MRIDAELIRLSATDLANHLACKHLTELDRAVAEGRRNAPDRRDPAVALLQKRGLAHEEAYVKSLAVRGLKVANLRDLEPEPARANTIDHMRRGVDVIVQAQLEDEIWNGRADVLVRVEDRSGLGNWSYEVHDTKLAQETRAGTILQLCLYTDLVAKLQGRIPQRMHVVKPEERVDTYHFSDFQAFYRLVKNRLQAIVHNNPSNSTYPYPVPHCDICRWWKACDQKRHDDDHICLVAGVGSLHTTELERQGTSTLEQFAEQEKPLREKPERGSEEVFTKAHEQARIQLAGRRQKKPLYELLPLDPGWGLARLPEPSAGDVFFDIESDLFVEGGGLEYLLGFAFQRDNGIHDYCSLWAHDQMNEKRAFEKFIDFLVSRLQRHPDLHIYHFSPYETGALKRLMGRHATREAEVDRLLRGERFVDLLAVTRQGLRASVESYSLKELECFFQFSRDKELPIASAALRRVEIALELSTADEISENDVQIVEQYNRDDCISTAALRDWLEERRIELEGHGKPVPRPEVKSGDASEKVKNREEHVQEVHEHLLCTLPEDRGTWSPQDHATWLLAHQLDYFRREDKCAWWEFFRLYKLEHEDLLGERKTVAGLQFQSTVGGTAKCPVDRYKFEAQEVGLREGDQIHEVRGDAIGTVDDVDPIAQTLDIKKRAKAASHHPIAVLVNEGVPTKPVDGSLLEFARSVAEHGLDGPGPFRAARDLLLKKPPRLRNHQPGSLRRDGEEVKDAAVRIASNLDQSVLPIQGPPGTGKTYTGAQMIAELASSGKRIGVTAVSHKVIENLLKEAVEAAKHRRVPLEVVHKVSREDGETPAHPNVEEVSTNDAALAALHGGKVLGATAWLWARDDAVETVDYLFVDEAGQMSLAQVLAASRSAQNIILIGDPQQLEQPRRGAHPEGAEVAALDHLLDGRQTIPDDKGLFLDVTWRLPPGICKFTSELYYEGRLHSLPGLEHQAITGDTPFAGSGLFYVPVTHEGNQNRSTKEIDTVCLIVDRLLRPDIHRADAKRENHELKTEDILVMAPYNAQLSGLARRLSGIRVGTVDRFQGQQAPVVIYSMASSSAEDAPRGMSFLYSPNRLNVATSRAKCVCILVASPKLFEPECRTPEQMRWANGLCRYREMATVLDIRDE